MDTRDYKFLNSCNFGCYFVSPTSSRYNCILCVHSIHMCLGIQYVEHIMLTETSFPFAFYLFRSHTRQHWTLSSIFVKCIYYRESSANRKQLARTNEATVRSVGSPENANRITIVYIQPLVKWCLLHLCRRPFLSSSHSRERSVSVACIMQMHRRIAAICEHTRTAFVTINMPSLFVYLGMVFCV